MKKITVLIAVITVSIFVTNCSKPAKEECKQQFITYDGALVKQLCSLPMDDTTGDTISTQRARVKLDAYKAHLVASGQNVKDAIYGFYFGKEELKAFVKKLNKKGATAEKDIIGARVYLVLSEDPNTKNSYQDVILVPVTRDRMNVVPIDIGGADKDNNNLLPRDAEPVLNTSTPCPNKCDKND